MKDGRRAAHPDGYHCLAVTVNQGTNQYYGWGDNGHYLLGGEVGDGGGEDNQSTPALLHFDEVCTTCVPLGTGGVFTAQYTGTLKLYFNDTIAAFDNNFGAYTARVFGVSATNVIVLANNGEGVPVGVVTNGGVYTYTASGVCGWDNRLPGQVTDSNGVNTNDNILVDCPSYGFVDTVCPGSQCASLVGRIQ